MHDDAAEVHARLVLSVGEIGTFERLGLIREWLTDISDFAADLDDPEFSKAVQRMAQWNLAAGEALSRRRTAERLPCCPDCGDLAHPAATLCDGCGAHLLPPVLVARVPVEPKCGCDACEETL